MISLKKTKQNIPVKLNNFNLFRMWFVAFVLHDTQKNGHSKLNRLLFPEWEEKVVNFSYKILKFCS